MQSTSVVVATGLPFYHLTVGLGSSVLFRSAARGDGPGPLVARAICGELSQTGEFKGMTYWEVQQLKSRLEAVERRLAHRAVVCHSVEQAQH